MSAHATKKSNDMSDVASRIEQVNPSLPTPGKGPLAQRLLMRPEEAATLLGVGRSTVYELLHAGELPTVHIRRTARIPLRAPVRWIERQTGA